MKVENEIAIPDELVMNKVYYFRGHKVMLDRDLAELYKVETKQLKRQVKRNFERFPEDFMFKLNENEFGILRSQNGTSSWGGTRYLPMVFTEHGILMLSSVLGSHQAVAVNIRIMRVFAKIRQALTDTTELRLAIEELRKKTDKNTQNIEVVFQCLDQLLDKKENISQRKKIGYKLP